MTHLETELKLLKESIIEMAELALSQLEKAREAYLNMDVDLAAEIIQYETRMNAFELSIDRNCENILALFNPVATDLRLVISAMKINSDLERIGDYSDAIADFIVDYNKKINPELIKATKLETMFDIALSMMEDIIRAFEEENSKLARKVYKKDKELNQINKDASMIISDYVKDKPETIRASLFLFSVIRKLERLGDHIKNIAEDIIFYADAVVYKHKKLKKKNKA